MFTGPNYSSTETHELLAVESTKILKYNKQHIYTYNCFHSSYFFRNTLKNRYRTNAPANYFQMQARRAKEFLAKVLEWWLHILEVKIPIARSSTELHYYSLYLCWSIVQWKKIKEYKNIQGRQLHLEKPLQPADVTSNI